MSQSSAIASVSAALFHLLTNEGISVTTLAPNQVAPGGMDQINLFLYATEANPAFVNSAMPGSVPRGHFGPPPLALVLRYLITAYGDNTDFSVHEIMGKAMLALHDNAILTKAQITGLVPDAGLSDQYEKIKITPLAMSLDDMSKLWTSFQTEYRLSAAYEVSVVLIESGQPVNAPLPVLKRGEQDRGASLAPAPAPHIAGLRFPNQKPAAELGDTISLLGDNLNAEGVSVRFQHPRLDTPIDLAPEPGGSESELLVKIPSTADDPDVGAKWPAGFYQISLLVQRPDTPDWGSNSLSMALSPSVLAINPNSHAAGAVTLFVDCLPQIQSDQQAALIFDGQLVPVTSIAPPGSDADPSTAEFNFTGAVARLEPYVVRLRVDGVDSIPVDFSGDTPEFDASQKVTIT